MRYYIVQVYIVEMINKTFIRNCKHNHRQTQDILPLTKSSTGHHLFQFLSPTELSLQQRNVSRTKIRRSLFFIFRNQGKKIKLWSIDGQSDLLLGKIIYCNYSFLFIK